MRDFAPGPNGGEKTCRVCRQPRLGTARQRPKWNSERALTKMPRADKKGILTNLWFFDHLEAALKNENVLVMFVGGCGVLGVETSTTAEDGERACWRRKMAACFRACAGYPVCVPGCPVLLGVRRVLRRRRIRTRKKKKSVFGRAFERMSDKTEYIAPHAIPSFDLCSAGFGIR